ncbi:hypothetical protein CA830_31280, partial [Burkholderia multivorans]
MADSAPASRRPFLQHASCAAGPARTGRSTPRERIAGILRTLAARLRARRRMAMGADGEACVRRRRQGRRVQPS